MAIKKTSVASIKKTAKRGRPPAVRRGRPPGAAKKAGRPVAKRAKNLQAQKAGMLLSIVIPVYNEEYTLDTILEKVLSVELPGFNKEIVAVDDCSKDSSWGVLQRYAKEKGIIIARHEKNQGKGAALHTGFNLTRGDIVLVQDADLEYSPEEYPELLRPFLRDNADVVYGSRFIGGKANRVLFFWHTVANRFLTLLSNMFTNLNLTDMETCYKVFKGPVIRGVHLEQKRFGFEPEITAKIARMKLRVYEVGISYSGRDYSEGKKIGFKDAIAAVWCIFKYNIFSRRVKKKNS